MSHNILGKTKMVRQAILSIITDGNMIINRIVKFKKSDGNNEEKKTSKQDNLSAGTNSKKIHILGDSVVKHVDG